MAKEIFFDDVHDAQSQFRIILDCMARPGKINKMADLNINPPGAFNKASAIIALSLLNADVSFCVTEGYGKELCEYIAVNTHASITTAALADFVFMKGLESEAPILETKTGTLLYPEDSATIIIDVEQLSGTQMSGATQITLRGPGVETVNTVYIKGINPLILETVKEMNAEFPLGVDLMLTDKNGLLICIPRSNRFEIVKN
jgi:alpha-D-ribose 1-methylphosphonate 5-triphosphate synthase subunit PhnH